MKTVEDALKGLDLKRVKLFRKMAELAIKENLVDSVAKEILNIGEAKAAPAHTLFTEAAISHMPPEMDFDLGLPDDFDLEAELGGIERFFLKR